MSNSSPSHWKIIEFKDIVEDSAFGPRFSGEKYSDKGNVATLRTTDMSEDGKISYETMPLAQLDESRFSKHFLQPGDLVISRSGRIGTTGIFEGFSTPVIPGAFLIRFRLIESINPLFYRYFFNSAAGKNVILSVARGAAQQNITSGNVLNLNIPLPPRESQDKISEILSAYDDLIENNRRRIQLLEQSARLLYKEWFVHLRFPGHEHVAIADGIPEGWEKVSIPNVIEVNPKESVEKGKEICYVPMSSLSESGMTVDSTLFERRTKHTSVKFRYGDILFARITPCLENGKTAYVNFLEKDEVACGSTEFIILRGKLVSDFFTYCLSRSHDFRHNAIKSMIGSSGRQRVQTTCFDDFFIGLPPALLLEQFDEFASRCFQQIQVLSAENYALAKARDILLPRLMNGDIAV